MHFKNLMCTLPVLHSYNIDYISHIIITSLSSTYLIQTTIGSLLGTLYIFYPLLLPPHILFFFFVFFFFVAVDFFFLTYANVFSLVLNSLSFMLQGKKFLGVNCGTNDASIILFSSSVASDGLRSYTCNCKNTVSSGVGTMDCYIRYWECPT